MCVEKCPTDYFVAKENDIKWQNLICTYNTSVTSSQTQEELMQLVKETKCARWYLPSTSSRYLYLQIGIIKKKNRNINTTTFPQKRCLFKKFLGLRIGITD